MNWVVPLQLVHRSTQLQVEFPDNVSPEIVAVKDEIVWSPLLRDLLPLHVIVFPLTVPGKTLPEPSVTVKLLPL